jgi:CRP-like cAMP-binding protein
MVPLMKKKVPKGRAAKPFDPKLFLSTIGGGRAVVSYAKKDVIFTQGDACDAVFYIQEGQVKLTVVSKTGKEATIGILPHDTFFGESSLAGQRLCVGTATALTDCSILRIEKAAMLKALHSHQELSDVFVEYLLAKNIRYQEDLIDQLFNSSEKRLARILLLFAGFGNNGIQERTEISRISQETLAEMVGTTRSRVNFFMNKFRRLGFIEYNGELTIHSSLLSVVLHE